MTTPQQISDLTISDGSIRSIRFEESQLVVSLLDWEERVWDLVFVDWTAIKAFNPENEDLDRIEITKSDPFIDECQSMDEETDSNLTSYTFFSAWTDKALLKIVSNTVLVRSIQE